MTGPPARRAAVGLAVLLALATGAAAQRQLTEPRRSQRGSVMQVVGQTRVEIAYGRPVARGRELFGALVPWGHMWHPGADTATQITVSTDVRVNGHRLAAGTYTIWAIPGRDAWTVIFSRAAPVWHVPYPGENKDALRVEVRPQTGGHMETLAFYFPVVDRFTTVLHLHWGTVVVPLEIRVD